MATAIESSIHLPVEAQTSPQNIFGEKVLPLPEYGSLLQDPRYYHPDGRLRVEVLDSYELERSAQVERAPGSETGLVQAAYAIPAAVEDVGVTDLVPSSMDVARETVLEGEDEQAKPAVLDIYYRHILHPIRSRRAFASHLADIAIDAALYDEWSELSREKLLDHIDPQRIDQLIKIASDIGLLWQADPETLEDRQALLTHIQELRWDLREANIRRAIRAPMILLVGIPLAVVGYEQATNPASSSAIPQLPEDPSSIKKILAFLAGSVILFTISSQRNDSVARRVLAKFERDLIKGDPQLVGRTQWQIGWKRASAKTKNIYSKLRNFAQTVI